MKMLFAAAAMVGLLLPAASAAAKPSGQAACNAAWRDYALHRGERTVSMSEGAFMSNCLKDSPGARRQPAHADRRPSNRP